MQVYGATAASIIEKYTKVVVTPQATSGGLEAAQIFAKGESQMCATDGYSLLQLYLGGKAPYIQATERVRLFSGAYRAFVHFLVRADSNINSFADLKGKRCMFQRPGFALFMEVYPVVLKAYGLSESDVTLMPELGYKESASALREKRADCIMQYSAPPAPEFLELSRAVPVRQLPIDPDKQAQILKEVPYEYIDKVLAGTYDGITKDTPALWIGSWLGIAKDLPDDFVYAAAKALVEHIDELRAAHAMFSKWQPQEIPANPLQPYHAGAFKYYKDAGLVKPEWEKKHLEMLKLKNQES